MRLASRPAWGVHDGWGTCLHMPVRLKAQLTVGLCPGITGSSLGLSRQGRQAQWRQAQGSDASTTWNYHAALAILRAMFSTPKRSKQLGQAAARRLEPHTTERRAADCCWEAAQWPSGMQAGSRTRPLLGRGLREPQL